MSNSEQQPFQAGDRVRHLNDCDHIGVVKSCQRIADPFPRWRVITTWHGNRRVALAAELELVESAPLPYRVALPIILVISLTAWALVCVVIAWMGYAP